VQDWSQLKKKKKKKLKENSSYQEDVLNKKLGEKGK